MPIKWNTPVETYEQNGRAIYVKREDHAVKWPGPPFSKIRGVYQHLKALKHQGVRIVGYVENGVSMGSWAVAYCAQKLGLKAVIFDPQYKHDTPPLLTLHRQIWPQFSPIIIHSKPMRLKIANNMCRKVLYEQYGAKAILLPNGLPFPETITETAKEWRRTMEVVHPKSTVICIGSGTIAAGILNGMKSTEGILYGVLVAPRDTKAKQKEICDKSHRHFTGLFDEGLSFQVVDAGWAYDAVANRDCPFPSHPNYDLKAWTWLCDNIQHLKSPILFWNIGRQITLEDLSI
jgi:1-aminocyclopropane-1-carboxylate deaminase/D-cysteine desulfhydrase-like pyridoxal-dependent ACC family enzyme